MIGTNVHLLSNSGSHLLLVHNNTNYNSSLINFPLKSKKRLMNVDAYKIDYSQQESLSTTTTNSVIEKSKKINKPVGHMAKFDSN